MLSDLNRTITKAMLGSDVLADLNSSDSLPGSIIAVPYGQNPPSGYSLFKTGDRKDFNWVQKQSSPSPGQYIYDAVVEDGNKIYWVGGTSNLQWNDGSVSNYTASTEIKSYDYSTNQWTSVTNMASARFRHAATCLNGKIYVIGGRNSSSTKIYDISNNQWTTGPSLPEVVENGRAIVFNGKIYLIGGKGNSAGYGISKTYELDLTTNQWSAKANMSVGRSGPELVIFENRIWAISSEHDSYNNTAESYDVVSNTWRSEPSLPKRCVTAWKSLQYSP